MNIPYRTRCFFRRLGVGLLILVIAVIVVFFYLFADLEQYVVYTRDGAKFNFSQSSKNLTGQVVTPAATEPVKIYYDGPDTQQQTSQELSPMIGYYVTQEELENDIAAVIGKIETLPAKTPVMIDVKSITGNFFYSSAVSTNRNSDIDTAQMDELIRKLTGSGCYAIARLPGLRDMLYGLNHTEDGLPVAAGYLWMDSDGCYWLNPSSDGTLIYLANIANELKNLGFDEVVFCDFYFPATDSIVFREDKRQALETAAQTLVNACAGDTFAVSFTVKDFFTPPSGRSRVYLENGVAAEADTLAAQFGFEDPQTRVVFLTTIHDTRFDKYSVLRPLSDME